MGYNISPTPRCDQLCYSRERKGSRDPNTEQRSRRVHFVEDPNRIITIDRQVPQEEIWYSDLDYIAFRASWRKGKRETVVPRSIACQSMSIGKSPFPSMEEYEKIRKEACSNRPLMVKTILLHQVSCSSRGYTDPDGISVLSTSYSNTDRKIAWCAGQVNAYEVAGFKAETQSVGLPARFMDYYLKSVHPLLNESLVLLSNVMFCPCDR